MSRGQPNGNHFLGHATHPVADFSFQTSHFLLHLLHGPRQHPRAIVQQSTVGRVVNVTLHHRRVHPHLSPLNHTRRSWARATIRSCNSRTVSGPIACPKRTSVLASGTFSIPIRQKLRYTTFARTSRSSVA